MTERSVLFPNSYLRNEPGMAKVDRKFYQSCPPFLIRIHLLNLNLNKQIFLILMSDVVVFSVISLLMASP
jgi:hypothetical protein